MYSIFDLSVPFTFTPVFMWPLKVSIAMSIAGFYGDDQLTPPGGVIQQAFLEWERVVLLALHT